MQMVNRRSVDLSGYPDLCVVLLGLRVRGWGGVKAALRIGPGLNAFSRDMPDGLLAHDQMLWGWNHLGIRQYWRLDKNWTFIIIGAVSGAISAGLMGDDKKEERA